MELNAQRQDLKWGTYTKGVKVFYTKKGSESLESSLMKSKHAFTKCSTRRSTNNPRETVQTEDDSTTGESDDIDGDKEVESDREDKKWPENTERFLIKEGKIDQYVAAIGH